MKEPTEPRRGTADQPRRTSAVLTAEAALADVERFIERGTREFRLTNVALFAAGFTTFALLYCVQPVMPVFSQEFGVSAAEASLSLSTTTLSLAFCMLIASSLSESLGRKPVMVASLFASSILMIGSAFAPSWRSFLILRALAGVTFSGLPATAMAYVGEEMHIRSSGMAMGLYIGGTGLGALGGRFIVGFMADFLSWRYGIFIVGVLALASSVVFVLFLPPSRHFTRQGLGIRALFSGFAANLTNPIQLGLYAQGFLLLGVFVSMYNYIGYRLIAPPYNYSQTVVALIFGISLVGILSAAWISDFSVRMGRQRIFWILVVLILCGVLMTLSARLSLILAGMTLLTFAFYGAHSVASSWVGFEATKAKAQASSLYLFSYYAGSSLLGSLGGFAWGHGGWPSVVWQSTAILLVALALALMLARSRSRTRRD
jgi:YNFM family putative membrane transporter